MKVFIYCMGICIIFTLHWVRKVESAAIICDASTVTANQNIEEKSGNKTDDLKPINPQENEVNKFLHKIQCTLEKAKPWMDELQQEAKRLEEAAKRLGLGILNSFGEFINKLAEEDAAKPELANEQPLPSESSNNSVILSTTTEEEVTTEIISKFLCPYGFIADHNGICERVDAED